MLHKMTFCLVAVMIITLGSMAGANDDISIKTMPPSVVKTIPQAGSAHVVPSLNEISVTFSKDMMTEKMWSWCSESPDTFPEADIATIRYLEDKRTCVLPVKLEPGKTYVIWINSQNNNAFRDIDNIPAIPYLLVFQTEPASSSTDSAEQAAVLAAESWLLLVDTGKYAESWSEGAHYFKAAVTQDRLVKSLQAARNPLGKNISRKLKSKKYMTVLPGAPDGKYVVIQYEASYENKKTAIETITPMLDKDGNWRVSDYYIR